ncbi:hypothetical protein F8388_024840, partial [Cannabis sativa]
ARLWFHTFHCGGRSTYMIMVVRMLSLCTTVRLEATGLNEASQPHPRQTYPTPRLSFAKPSWVVRTEASDPLHVQMFIEKKRKRQIHLVWSAWGVEGLVATLAREEGGRTVHTLKCSRRGSGQNGEALNSLETVLCRTCGGSGLDYCPRCLGTGEYRYVMGFQFMKRDVSHTQDRNERRSVADFYEE